MHDKHGCFKTSNSFNKYWTTKKIGSVYSSLRWTEPLLTRIFRPSDRLTMAQTPLSFSLSTSPLPTLPSLFLPCLPPARGPLPPPPPRCTPSVGVLTRQTYQGGTRGSRLCSGGSWSGERELEGMRKDTGHKIYTGPGRQGGEPYVLFGGSSMAPCAWCWVEIRCPARYPTLLYIV
jgi:hypothetical protein